jgi:CheY-like chemotaxis protein
MKTHMKTHAKTQNTFYTDDRNSNVPSMTVEHRWAVSDLTLIRKINLTGVRILLAEDSPDNQKLFSRILTSAGASVDIAENGAVAVDKCNRPGHAYDAIIMDVRMPTMDGYQATRMIRAYGYTGPILALTAHATPGEEERCRAAGCSEFHLKPIDRLTLLSAVERSVQSLQQSSL